MKKKQYCRILMIIVMAFLFAGCGKKEAEYVEVNVDCSVFDDKFYYEQLSEEEKKVYGEIYQGIQNGDDSICIHDIAPEKANKILENVIYDFPEIFWADGSASSTQYGESMFEQGYTVIQPEYVYSQEERDAKNAQIEAQAAEILSSIPEEYGEYEKIKWIYEYLIGHIEYVEDAEDNQNIYSALVNGASVCAGYAKANQYLLNQLGIYCTYVTGTAQNEDGTDTHAWNIVRCNGKYYYVDVTWADPIIEGEQVVESAVLYDYLCCSEKELLKTHTLDEGYTYFACDSEDLNYYRMHQMYYETADEQTMMEAMTASIDRGDPVTIFKFADADLYEEGRNRIINDLAEEGAIYLGSQYNLWEVRYFYEEYSLLNKMVVYWNYE